IGWSLHLKNKLKNKSPTKTLGHSGVSSILGDDIENLLEDWVLTCAEMEFPIDQVKLFRLYQNHNTFCSDTTKHHKNNEIKLHLEFIEKNIDFNLLKEFKIANIGGYEWDVDIKALKCYNNAN
ncbi:Jerky-like, partial [Aphis craccivora]